MEVNLHYEILDKKRREILPKMRSFKKKFYLAGGTALALQIGHRDSVDFDFFTDVEFDRRVLHEQVQSLFADDKVELIQDALNTLSLIIDGRIKMSFFKLPYGIILPLIETENLNLLPAKEIAAMKLIALLRATFRDYVDMYYLLKIYSLDKIFNLARKKYENLDVGIYIKCLMSYSDVEITPIKFKKGFEVTPKKVFSSIEVETTKYLKRSR